jgi:hypothetical protein
MRDERCILDLAGPDDSVAKGLDGEASQARSFAA